ncbi:MAG: SPOR domain-containing protein [Arenimonas sp.]
MLRAIVLLLACMNVGVGLWWALHRDPVYQALPALEPGIAGLSLLRETERSSLPAAAELDAAPAPLADMPVCLSIGPFETPADLRAAMGRLMPEVGKIQFRELPATALRGYRVFLPAAASRAAALTSARALAERGLRDYYVVTAGEQQNTVSLGLFRDLENAKRRQAEVAALGYAATVEARTEQMPQWWVDIAAPEGFDWTRVLPGATVQARSVPCF